MRNLTINDVRQLDNWQMETDQFGLKKGEMWKSPDDFHILSINCTQGTVWITQTGDAEDHLLQPGEVFETLEEGLVIMQSLTDCAAVAILRG